MFVSKVCCSLLERILICPLNLSLHLDDIRLLKNCLCYVICEVLLCYFVTHYSLSARIFWNMLLDLLMVFVSFACCFVENREERSLCYKTIQPTVLIHFSLYAPLPVCSSSSVCPHSENTPHTYFRHFSSVSKRKRNICPCLTLMLDASSVQRAEESDESICRK